MPWSRNDAFIIAWACASSSALPGTLATAAMAQAGQANAAATGFAAPLALPRWCSEAVVRVIFIA